MGFDPISITGKPRHAATPLVGFPWEIPLDRTPPEEWQAYFAGYDWAAKTGLRDSCSPKLHAGSLIVIPSLKNESEYPALLDAIDAAIAEINGLVSQAQDERERAEADANQTASEKAAAADAVFDDWWGNRRH